MSLVNSLIEQGWLKTDSIKAAFKKVQREDFLPEDTKKLADLNEALPIGFGQTISQPLVVAFMLEELQPKPGEKILDVGSGSGWTSALLAQIVGEKGKVVALEIIPELKEFGEKNAAKYNMGNLHFILEDGSVGFEKEAPFDKILVSASGDNIPKQWEKQLKVGGKMVVPIGSSIWTILKKSDNKFEKIEHTGFVFVPLVKKQP